MIEICLMIRNKVGMHARPAAMFVQTARKFESEIVVINQGRSASGKDVINLVKLGIYQNSEFIVQADGRDEVEAVEALKNLVENNFGEMI